MKDNQKDMQQLTASLEEIKHLEAKLSTLKRQLLESSSSVMNGLPAEGESASFLVVRVLDRRFAVPVGGVEEVIEMVAPIPLTDKTPGVVGLINYHSNLIALFDLAEIAGLGHTPVSEDDVVVVCILGDKRFAVMVAEASDVVTVPKSQVRTAEEVLSGFMREIAVIQIGRDTASVIDLWSAVMSLPLGIDQEDVLTSQEPAMLGDEGTE